MSDSHKGTCFCGAVRIEAAGQPSAMGYCHCRSCRSWSGGPASAFTLWSPKSVRVAKGEQHIATYSKTAFSERQFCRLCSGHLMMRYPSLNMVDVFAATIPGLKFSPQVHVNCAATVLPMHDRLPNCGTFPRNPAVAVL